MSLSSSTGQAEYFTGAARRLAISDSLPLVGTYFQRGGRLNAPLAALGRSNDGHGELVGALRLRVAIAAADRLSVIVQRALRTPNFRYGTRREGAVGTVRGRLDIQTLIRQNGRFDTPPRYPVVVVERQFSTPENILLACALMWVRRELRLPISKRVNSRAAEVAATTAAISLVDHALGRLELRNCKQQALVRLARGEMDSLCDEVERRIAAGHVNGEAYGALVAWVQSCLAGSPAAEPGELEWSFYGAEFDPRLFEIWLLSQLRSRLGNAAGIELDSWDFFDSAGPIDVNTTQGRLRLTDQKSLRGLRGDGTEVRWRDAGGGSPLGERPDFLVALDTPEVERTVVIDAKLRQRTRPTEEIYKVLGYLNNYGMDGRGLGAIIYYAANPSEVALYDYRAEDGGRVIAFSVDPERPAANEEGWAALVELVGLA